MLGRKTTSILSSQFFSGAFLEPTIDTTDYVDHIDRFAGPPSLKQRSGPEGEVKKGGLKFKFSSDDPGARFECRLDSKDWTDCESPEKLKGASEGKHRFQAQAIDAGGLESKRITWRFEVV